MIREVLRRVATVGFFLAVPAILEAGANTWTGGRPVEAEAGIPAFLAADPGSPDVVYGGFGTRLLRSSDGGRTWRLSGWFNSWITAILVHPASPSTIYVAASDVFKSTDSGETWSSTSVGWYVESLAGSPTDASTVFAGGWNRIFKTTDAGATWSWVDMSGVIASLVISPRNPTVAYAGAEGIDYWGLSPGSLGKTTDGGTSWRRAGPQTLDSVLAVAVDSVASSTVYAAAGPYRWSEGAGPAPAVLRSDDDGVSWTSASAGLPGVTVRCLVVDPRVSGTLYAGTETGVYRSRDGGRTWTPFGQRLASVSITSLAIDDAGRRLHAGTAGGAYDLEIALGPVDVSAGPSGGSRVLLRDGDRAAVGTVDAAGHWSGAPPRDASAFWTAVAIAEGGSGRSHVLWQNGDGRSALEILGPAGKVSATVFGKRSGWMPADLSARADGQTNVLWTDADGRMSIARVSTSGAVADGPVYGPAEGWSAIAIADAAGGDTWVLWRATDGRAGLSIHRDGVVRSSYHFAAHLDWAVEDLAVAADGRPRVLRTSPGGLASVATVDAAGRLTEGQRYTLPGFTPRRIAAGADGLTRLLFASGDGQGELLLLDSDNTVSAHYALDPLALQLLDSADPASARRSLSPAREP